MTADARPVLVLATRNPGKVRELRALLGDLPLEVKSLLDFPDVPPPTEEGTTYAENAIAKAQAIASATGLVALADDSGLDVDALDGAPGPWSNRWLGEEASDADRNAALLERLREVAPERRTARFRAVVAIAHPDGRVRTFDGAVEGRIADRPAGHEGFGYDPIFLVKGEGRTMAELGMATKNRISHRAKAVQAARTYLAMRER
ncbi:MAG TPA: RdgB/HAM1 family non-canonical purine NTP pyrophosphatase [bacterium]|jgi:XTP/dITP diphosphohydrolase|nr:RdgB/HAM1 family non-canonical purine NTP pyrophosphatase [bacterium]